MTDDHGSDRLRLGDERSPAPAETDLICDFVGGALGRRLRAGVGRHEPLARAVGLRPGRSPVIVDATAGLGRDAMLMAALGHPVTLIERSPAMHAALSDAIAAARAAGGKPGEAAARLTLILGDARDHLGSLAPDVVLVDPMHPARRKAALVKLAMRQVRDLVGGDADALDLMRAAIGAARGRVVLKWPLRAPPIPCLPAPHHAIRTKTLRFDVFMAAARMPA